ncbi:MAG: Maf family protein [Bacteroidota bacterium]
MTTTQLNILQQPILLATQSPRRKQLMQEAGFTFRARATHVAEDFPADMPKVEVAAFLARKKALAARAWIVDDEIVLAADSTVLLDGELYEKPQDEADAKRMLRALSGQIHQVITGVCFCSKDSDTAFSVATNVYFETLSEAEIDYYVRTCQPYDKAGSYGVQEWLGHCKVKQLEGSFTNVMGLPMYEVYHELGKFLER